MFDLMVCYSGLVYTLIYAATFVISKCLYRIQKSKLKEINITDERKPSEIKKARYSRRRVKIMIMGVPTIICMMHSYNNICQQTSQLTHWDIFGCLKWSDTEKLGRGILMSFYMNSVLYIGPIYQEIWNGDLRKKLAKLSFNKFRWDYFTKIVINPLIDEIIFRGLVNNAVNSNFNNNLLFIIYSTILYTTARTLCFIIKYTGYSWKQLAFEILNGILLGSYLSYVLCKTQTLATVIINHGYLNFMGRPNFDNLFNDHYFSDEQRQKTIKFYFYGFSAFIILCILVL